MNSDDLTLPSPPQITPPPEELQGHSPKELFARGLETPASGKAGEWTPPSAQRVAELLPQYHIEGLIGRGGMGAVYKGFQPALERAVAIKLLPAELSEDAEFIARFQREARMLAKLHHSGIVAIHDFGQTPEGHLYFVMEFVDGMDLAHIIRNATLTPAQTLELTIQICDALHYAHSQGLIHRDIKPANILVTKEGRAKMADFGLARPVHEEAEVLTASHVVMGTAAYMAPEQREGHADHRADIYALGVLLYEMLTGKRPEGVFEPPSVRADADARLDTVVLKAMQQEPDRRYQQASEMRTDVEEIRTTPAQDGAPPEIPQADKKARPFFSRPLVWAALLMVSLIMAGGFLYWKVARPGNITGDPLAATKERPFANSLGMKFVPVPGTKVLFCIHDTRKGDYRKYAEARAGLDDSWKDAKSEAGNLPVSYGEDHPVVMVSWDDAQGFCKWLSAKEGRIYRLPTDTEWSWAVGIGDQEDATALPQSKDCKIDDVYPWGDQWPPPAGSGNYADLTLKEKLPLRPIFQDYTDGYATTSPVMHFKPNGLGLYDMGGNVWQWCEDRADAEGQERVLRGGCWAIFGRYGALSSARFRAAATFRRDAYGFRVVIEKFREALREDLKDSSTIAAEPPKPAEPTPSKTEPSAPVVVSSKFEEFPPMSAGLWNYPGIDGSVRTRQVLHVSSNQPPSTPVNAPPDESAGMEGVFLPTRWSMVGRAVAAQEPGAAQALATLCESWWYPIYAFIRRAGQTPHNAEDLTQGFFEKLLASNLLADADPAKGRLRTFLLTCVKRFMADEHDRVMAGKRGGGRIVNLSSVRAEERYAAEPVDDMTPDRLYQRRWALTVLETTLRLLSEQYAAAGKKNLFEALHPFLGFGHEGPEGYEAVASRLGMNTSTLKSHVRRLRLDWREILMGQVAGTLDEPSSDNVRDELAELMGSV